MVCANSALNKSTVTISPNSICLFHVSVSYFGNSLSISSFLNYICYSDLQSVISDVTIEKSGKLAEGSDGGSYFSNKIF